MATAKSQRGASRGVRALSALSGVSRARNACTSWRSSRGGRARGGPRQIAEVAREVGADPDALERILRALVAMGVFTQPEPGVVGPHRRR